MEDKKAGRRTVKQMRTEATATRDPAAGTSSTALYASKETRAKNLEEIKEFCRVANISVWQNTKGRSLTGYKDDEGNYHVMYRCGIAQVLIFIGFQEYYLIEISLQSNAETLLSTGRDPSQVL